MPRNVIISSLLLFAGHAMSVRQGEDATPPSSVAKFPVFKKEHQKRPIMNGRPVENHGLPVHLFHPAFSRFQHTLNNLNVDLTPDDYIKAHRYISMSAALYAAPFRFNRRQE